MAAWHHAAARFVRQQTGLNTLTVTVNIGSTRVPPFVTSLLSRRRPSPRLR